MKTKNNYYRYLDVIRILACVLVLLYHLGIVQGGYLAVCTFFVLTGYLSTTSALKKEKFSIKEYYVGRIRKIYLPLLVVTFITVIVAKNLSFVNWLNLKPETTSVVLGYNNFWQLEANIDYFTRHVNSPFMHFWYIAILLQFEILFPIAFSILQKIDKKINNNLSTLIVFVLMITSTVLLFTMSKTQEMMMVYYNTFARCFSIFFGIFLAVIHHKYDIKIARSFEIIWPLMFIGYIAVLCGLCSIVSSDTPYYALFMLITTIISCRLIEYATLKKTDKNPLDKAIEFIARASYEIYLVQYPIIYFVTNSQIDEALQLLVIIVATILLAFVLYLLFNNHFKNKAFKITVAIVSIAIIAYGGFLVASEDDHAIEMKELELKLDENLKLIEQRNQEYLNNLNTEQEEWNKVLENMENEEAQIIEAVHKIPVVGVGDSVLLAASNGLYKNFPNGYFDGKVSRTIVGGKELLAELQEQGKLGDTIILALANNGDYIPKRNKDFMEFLEGKEVYWVNAVLADDPKFNEKFAEFAKDYPNLHIVDWEGASKDHPEYFYADGIHVKGDGIQAYADVVFDAICDVYLERYREENKGVFTKHEEEIKNKITFYGDETLTSAFDKIQEKFDKASINVKSDFVFGEMYNDIKSKIENDSLEHKVAFIFNESANITEEDYISLIELCKEHDIYFCDISKEGLKFEAENVEVIDFRKDILENDNYLMSDRMHLSKEGNLKLVEKIYDAIIDKEN